MSSIPMELYLLISAFMFSVGVAGVLIRRNAIVVFMCVELMLNSANLALITFSSYLGDPAGQVFVFFVMTVAAAEAAVGLAIIIAIFRNKQTVNIDEINIFKW
ncbi:MAG: NADH-quinone oxidoreductase subunit NuoK [Melioribacteraceae bacterium]|nr:NADH-quinone oxidoreductase subunit NuoK [Melioribacteraceae bacterium]